MIILKFLACSIHLAGTPCKDVELNFEGQRVSIFECTMYGQVEMAKWCEEHPNWVVTRYKCEDESTMTKSL